MVNIDFYFDEVDRRRLQRVRELSDMKIRFTNTLWSDPFSIRAKATVVLAYSHWEGFYNECSQSYIDFLKMTGVKIREVEWLLLVGAIEGELQALMDRKHSFDAKCEFLNSLQIKIESTFQDYFCDAVKARSNLNFARLRQTYKLLGFDTKRFDKVRIRLDKELVGWRHSVAHGEPPNLSSLDIEKHIDFTSELLLFLSEQFQTEMLNRI
jgi:hypothetical protein